MCMMSCHMKPWDDTVTSCCEFLFYSFLFAAPHKGVVFSACASEIVDYLAPQGHATTHVNNSSLKYQHSDARFRYDGYSLGMHKHANMSFVCSLIIQRCVDVPRIGGALLCHVAIVGICYHRCFYMMMLSETNLAHLWYWPLVQHSFFIFQPFALPFKPEISVLLFSSCFDTADAVLSK